MSTLMMHDGGKTVERGIVLDSPTPSATKTHVPVPHGKFLNSVLDALKFHNYEIQAESHGLSHGGDRYFGTLQLTNGTRDYGLMLGLRNDHAKTFPASLCAGSRVFVCDNLAFSGEIKISRRHTRHILQDLPPLIGRMTGRLANYYNNQERQFAAYKQAQLTDDRARSLMVEGVKRGVIGCTHLPKVLNAWENPPYEEFSDPTVWRFFNAVTEVAKEWKIHNTMTRTQLLHGLCDLEVGLAS